MLKSQPSTTVQLSVGLMLGVSFFYVFDEFYITHSKKEGCKLFVFRMATFRSKIQASLICGSRFRSMICFLGGVRRGAWRFIVQHPGIHRDIL
jgi:hypothetical protein